MGKSEKKSNWKRKFRAIRREKNEKKVLLKLNQCLENKCPEPIVTLYKNSNKIDVDLDVNNLKQEEADDETMKDEKTIYNAKTKLNANGNYPPWMNQRSIKKLKKRLKPSSRKS